MRVLAISPLPGRYHQAPAVRQRGPRWCPSIRNDDSAPLPTGNLAGRTGWALLAKPEKRLSRIQQELPESPSRGVDFGGILRLIRRADVHNVGVDCSGDFVDSSGRSQDLESKDFCRF
jgi:hypothetical protein